MKKKRTALAPKQTSQVDFTDLYEKVRAIIEESRGRATRAVNTEMVRAYWLIGQAIVEQEQQGKQRAGYGEGLIELLAARLTADFGKGFTTTNLKYMRQFYLTFGKSHALRGELTWTHYRLLLRVENPEARAFYETEAAEANWSTRQMERQINSLFYERVALSRSRRALLTTARAEAETQTPMDFIKDPFVLEFLGLRESRSFLERDLETAILDHMQEFLLELGKGFAFVGRQARLTLDGDHFYIDLVFYNYLLRCFVLIDLKIGKLMHQDLGQMQMYVNFYHQERTPEGDNPPIGLVLCADKNEAVVRYTLGAQQSRIQAARYQLYLPSEAELAAEVRREQERFRQQKMTGARIAE
ncbi:MAG TPA: PDDEXK nuclease domain-containing protein [Blastocatellia bacterium]|nr:PDDEXK nuclease domain-containing protein [Blastocatellia bacterium]